MKYTLLIACLLFGLAGCKKDKFTTAPQITFVDLKPNIVQEGLPSTANPALIPKLIFEITDSEGDFGNSPAASDSSWIYVKHLLLNELDSFRFPDLQRAPKNNFKAEVTVGLLDAIGCASTGPLPRTDTVYYEVYVKDAKGHKSNVIKTGKPLLTQCQ